MIIISSSSSSLCSHSVPWLGEGCVHICLFCARWYPSSSCLVRLQRLTGLFLSQGFQLVTHSVHRLSRILLTCPAQVHFRLLTCSITSVTLVFSLTQMFVFLSWYVMFKVKKRQQFSVMHLKEFTLANHLHLQSNFSP